MKNNPTGHACGPRIYVYKGWKFEVSPSCGPWPLKQNGDPRERAGAVFYEIFSEFNRLSKEDKLKHRIGGGCEPI